MSYSVKDIYRILLKEYGAQGWWPVTPAAGSSPKYSGGPATRKEQLEVIIGAILTQNTSWKNVEKALENLIKAKLISTEKILKTDQDELAALIRPSGYFNQKAQKLKRICLFLKTHDFQQLDKIPLPELRKLLLSVNGVGPETADSIILYAFRKPAFVIDTYTKRIFSRLGFCSPEISYYDLQSIFENNLRSNHKTYNQYHALIVEHGKNICKKKPLCHLCILEDNCPKKGMG